MRFIRHVAASALVLVSFGCGGGENPGTTFKDNPTTGGPMNIADGSGGRANMLPEGSIITGTGGSIGSGGSGQAGSGSLAPDARLCGALEFGVETQPFNMLIMFDQSSSMNERLDATNPTTRWQAVTSALKEFLQSSDATPLSIGLSYFEQVDANSMTSCDVARYTTPEVPIAKMDAAQVMRLVNSIDSHAPTGLTPTAPALKGALDHAKTYAMTHSGKTLVVLATDGIPTQCEPQSSMQIATDIAGPAFMGMPSIRTFVIAAALGLTSLGSISRAGGTGEPVVVTDPNTTSTLIKGAFQKLSRTNFACSYRIPPGADGGRTDPTQVNVMVSPSGQASMSLTLYRSGDGCGTANEGWYYDNPAMPENIVLCPATCNNLFNGELRIAVGCAGPPPM